MSEAGAEEMGLGWTRSGVRSRLADVPSLYTALLLAGLTAAGFYLLLQLQFLLVLLFLSVLLASGIASPVHRLEQRGVPRPVAIGLIYLAIFGVLAGIGWYVLPRLVGQAVDIAAALPQWIDQAEQLQRRVEDLGQEYPIIEQLDARLTVAVYGAGGEVTGWVLEMPAALAKFFFSLVTILTLAFLLLLTKERLIDLLLSLFQPRHRVTTRRVLDEMGARLGAYLRARLIVMVIVGFLIFVTLFFLGSPYPVLIAIFASIFEALPRIGPWTGRIAIFLSMLPLGWEKVAMAIAAHVVIQNLKGYVLRPAIEGSQVDIHPLTVFIAVIAGALLLGWIGALIAVPTAVVVQVVVEEVLIPWRHRQLARMEQAQGAGPSTPEPDPAV